MRIAHVTSSLFEPLGGAEQYCIELATWQASAGHVVRIFGAGASPALRTRLAALGIEVHDLARPRPYQPGVRGTRFSKVLFHAADLVDSVLRPRRLVRRLSDEHEVVHVHRWQGLGIAPLRLRSVATVHTVHDFALVDTAATSLRGGRPSATLPLPQRLRAALLRALLRDLDLAVFPTRRTRDRHADLGLDLGDRSVVIPHGWRLPTVPAAAARRSSEEPLQITFMGKLIGDKGIDVLLDAWADGIPGARLVIAGAGERETRVRKRAAAVDGIEFRGWLDKSEQAALLSETDLLVLPSLWPENFPLVVAEALLAAVPVLATEVSAPEALEDGRNAVITPGGATPLRDAIQRVLSDRKALEPLREGARASAQELDMAQHGATIDACYRTALQRRLGRGAARQVLPA